jgi:chromosome partitioning protein
MGTIIAIYNAKGGEGKTTLTVNAGAVAARARDHGICTRDLSTLIVEFDPQGNTSAGLGVTRDFSRTVGAVLAGRISTEDAIQPTYLPNLSVLSADLVLAEVEAKMETDAFAIERLALALENVRKRFDLILVDCCPGMGWLFRIAMRAADAYVIPMRLEAFSFDGLRNCMEQMEVQRPRYQLRAALLGIALLGVDYRLQRHTTLESEVRETYASAVFRTGVRQNEPVAHAPFTGRAVVDVHPKCRGSEGFLAATREMLERAARRRLFDPRLLLADPGAADRAEEA